MLFSVAEIKTLFKEHARGIYVFFAVLMFGVAIGILLPGFLAANETVALQREISSLMQVIPSGNLGGNLQIAAVLLNYITLLLLLFVFGFLAIGLPFIILTVLLHGVSLGVACSMLYFYDPAIGMIVMILAILPAQFIFVPVIVISGYSSAKLSFDIAKGCNIWGKQVLGFVLLFVVLILLVSCGAVLAGYILPRLLSLFISIL